MVVEHIFKSIRFVLNKNRRGFVKTPDIITAVKMAINDIYDAELEYYRTAGIVSAKIKRFVKTASINIADGTGDLPVDFVKEINFVTNNGDEGDFVSSEEFDDRTESLILQPDENNPIAKLENNKIVLAPIDYPSVDLVYFSEPVDFVYAYTVPDGRTEVFNEGGSEDVQFNKVFSGDIIRRSLVYLGVANQNAEAASLSGISNQQQ